MGEGWVKDGWRMGGRMGGGWVKDRWKDRGNSSGRMNRGLGKDVALRRMEGWKEGRKEGD